MHKDFAPLLLIVAAQAFACGGGDAAPVDGLDNSGVPNDTDVPNDSTIPAPPAVPIDSDLPADNSSTPPGGPGAGVNPTCSSLCQTAEEQGCGEEFSDPACVSDCAELAQEPCGNQTLALLSCALSVGLCPEDAEEFPPALTTACLGPISALLACAGVDPEAT